MTFQGMGLGQDRIAALKRKIGWEGVECSTVELLLEFKRQYPEEASAFTRGFVKAIAQGSDDSLRQEQRERNRREADEAYGVTFLQIMNDGCPTVARTFDTWIPRPKYSVVQEAHDAVRAWVNGTGKGLLTLIGTPGTGKSHLAIASAHALKERGEAFLYRQETDLISDLMVRLRDNRFEPALDEVLTVPWLIIDELGLSALKEWGKATMDRIINARWEQAGVVRTLVISNLQAKDMEPRVASRLGDATTGRVVSLDNVPDYRSVRRG